MFKIKIILRFFNWVSLLQQLNFNLKKKDSIFFLLVLPLSLENWLIDYWKWLWLDWKHCLASCFLLVILSFNQSNQWLFATIYNQWYLNIKVIFNWCFYVCGSKLKLIFLLGSFFLYRWLKPIKYKKKKNYFQTFFLNKATKSAVKKSSITFKTKKLNVISSLPLTYISVPVSKLKFQKGTEFVISFETLYNKNKKYALALGKNRCYKKKQKNCFKATSCCYKKRQKKKMRAFFYFTRKGKKRLLWKLLFYTLTKKNIKTTLNSKLFTIKKFKNVVKNTFFPIYAESLGPHTRQIFKNNKKNYAEKWRLCTPFISYKKNDLLIYFFLCLSIKSRYLKALQQKGIKMVFLYLRYWSNLWIASSIALNTFLNPAFISINRLIKYRSEISFLTDFPAKPELLEEFWNEETAIFEAEQYYRWFRLTHDENMTFAQWWAFYKAWDADQTFRFVNVYLYFSKWYGLHIHKAIQERNFFKLIGFYQNSFNTLSATNSRLDFILERSKRHFWNYSLQVYLNPIQKKHSKIIFPFFEWNAMPTKTTHFAMQYKFKSINLNIFYRYEGFIKSTQIIHYWLSFYYFVNCKETVISLLSTVLNKQSQAAKVIKQLF